MSINHYGHERHGPSPLSTVRFDDVKPLQIQLYFTEIHQALRLANCQFAESAILNLRRAADDYVHAVALAALPTRRT